VPLPVRLFSAAAAAVLFAFAAPPDRLRAEPPAEADSLSIWRIASVTALLSGSMARAF
jgi:hypothetical protein